MNQVDKNEDGDCTDEKMVPDSTCLSPWVTGSGAFNHSNFQVPTLHRAVPPFMFVNRKSLELYVRSGIRKSMSSTEYQETSCHRSYMTKFQRNVLKKFYVACCYPTREQKERLAKEIGLPILKVSVWFQNQRSHERRRTLESTNLNQNEELTLSEKKNERIASRRIINSNQ